MFIVTWIDGSCMNTRAYSKREYAEVLVKWCKKHDLDYHFAEETVDREILDQSTILGNRESVAKRAK